MVKRDGALCAEKEAPPLTVVPFQVFLGHVFKFLQQLAYYGSEGITNL